MKRKEHSSCVRCHRPTSSTAEGHLVVLYRTLDLCGRCWMSFLRWLRISLMEGDLEKVVGRG